MAWAFESKSSKYEVAWIVSENKSGLWTYKGLQGYHIHLCSSSNLTIEKSFDSYTNGQSPCVVWRGRLKVKQLVMMLKIEFMDL
jgi:hypothetical protein